MRPHRAFRIGVCLLLALLVFIAPAAMAGSLPDGFVYVIDVIPDITCESRSCSADNCIRVYATRQEKNGGTGTGSSLQ